MKTSNFANNKLYGLNGISISRYPATRQGFTGPEFPPLMPSTQLLNWYKTHPDDWQGYCDRYNDFNLKCLNPQATWEALNALAQLSQPVHAAVSEPILLCYESAKTLDTQPCHRRLVADWFERELGVVVPEWTKEVAQ
jgi:uncharacterized protein YeaO (DUF488 family)